MKTQTLFRALAPGIVVAGLVVSATDALHAQQDDGVHVWPVQNNIYMIVGAGGNITMQVGEDGILLVDAGLAAMTDEVLAAIRTVSDKTIYYLINTHHHPDHTGGNLAIHDAGDTNTGGNVAGDIADAGEGAAIIAHENLLGHLVADEADARGWPTSTYFGDKKTLWFNGEGIEILHMPNAHTDGDSVVFFRRSDVIATGDIFTTVEYPIVDLENGGTYQGTIDALNRISDMVIPIYGQDGGTLIVPGHGRVSGFGDLLNFREMANIIGDRIQYHLDNGATLEQVKAARPTLDYDPLFGGEGSFMPTDRFVEMVYTSLSQGQ